MKNLVIGAIHGYEWKDVEPFVVSLENTGFDGHKCMIIYTAKQALIDKLEDRGWTLFGHQKAEDGDGVTYQNVDTFNICVDRFYHYWAFLKDIPVANILACDVKDVVFQSDPFERAKEIYNDPDGLPKDTKILSSGEGLLYKDEPWGWNNITQSFGPPIADKFSNKEIINAGVIYGDGRTMLDLFLHIFLTSRGAPYHVPGGGGPDQAAYNIVAPLFNNYIVADENAWACQAGTTADPSKIEEFRDNLVSTEPVWDGEQVMNTQGKPYAIVHQYDRVPEWNKVMDKKYRETE